MKPAVRYLSYPAVMGGLALTLVVLAASGVAYWPVFPLLVVAGMAVVALLERLAPFEPDWNRDHDGDTRVDVLHLLVSHALIQISVAGAFGLRLWVPQWPPLWPAAAPMWAQVLVTGAIMDLGLYLMHRASHASGFLWRLHAIHHMPERLYWLNGGRRHPLSALVLAGPGLTVLLALGATPIAVGAWLGIMSVHLAFQHANLDYRLGPFRHLLGVAEMHRWHHKRDFEDAQVNFGEVFLIWDRIFGTHHDAPHSPARGEVGLNEADIPTTYIGQLLWPLRRSST
ncbi:MAG: sterol desaturase family protein [Sinimarinibacterium flocculans]|jgi:sterol desaturase/sphingolipid hydroxylase (fatty acid hydroxylase superfamily)|uniref:Sterol desaturase/sphingolipid hydroxylase (Fatty acid hydroxylase superfamily) n=1 Tax=Sinimarinibacterium flocculans TaxID=985250 RepID=A0A318DZT2_9GAMM|nr:sterol desaturase family protein [Sinimarinibacterium flocculans]MEC9357464.1 sterol desaturase family protein [Pseudomonadota bacterium]PXV63723.1 sterol desaturase/sphingolipid hydroxylase (fatty acid hydroxylase superfamily) [Sinimarinibacterium flocculans]